MPNFGFKHTEETRRKIGLAGIGRKHSEESKQKMRNARLGKKRSHEDRIKISLAKKTRPWTSLQYISFYNRLDKVRDSMKGAKNFMYGKHRTDEQKIRHSELMSGKNNPFFGKKHNEKTIKKMKEKRRNTVIPNKDTKPERMMQIALSLNQVKYEKHRQDLIGYPDIFIEPNICIFIDGDFWHANPEKYSSESIIRKHRNGTITAKDIWARDLFVSHKLNELGYQVIRIWENKILKDANCCAENIIKLAKQYGLTNKMREVI